MGSIGCFPAAIAPGCFDGLHSCRLHLAAGDQALRFLGVDPGPDAFWSTRRKLLQPVSVIIAFFLSVDPAVTESHVHGFIICYRWDARSPFLQAGARRRWISRAVLPARPTISFYWQREGPAAQFDFNHFCHEVHLHVHPVRFLLSFESIEHPCKKIRRTCARTPDS